jgi:hypothetical protein
VHQVGLQERLFVLGMIMRLWVCWVRSCCSAYDVRELHHPGAHVGGYAARLIQADLREINILVHKVRLHG